MSIKEIIFNIISRSPHLWVRYWITKEFEGGITLPGEYVELRSGFITDDCLKELLEAGFKIKKIKVQIINADAYADVLLKREL